MIRNIVFDVGKVLVSYEPDAYMDSLGLDAGAKARLNAAVFENPLWDASDQGLGTPEELLEQFILGDVELEDQIRYLYDAYSLKPGGCVFLDDRPENIRGAQDTGMHGIVFRDYASAKRELLDFLRDSNI